eukprot:403370379
MVIVIRKLSNSVLFSLQKQDFQKFQTQQGHLPIEIKDKEHKYNLTRLHNGLTILTETESFPGAVHMGVLVDVGSRDETPETSGCLLALKNSFLKTSQHSNETLNYNMIQMSGGDTTLEFDQERLYLKSHCIEYDAVDILNMIVDITTEPRIDVVGEIARFKNKKQHELFRHMSQFDPSSKVQEMLMKTAYGNGTLGMPIMGMEENVENINGELLRSFVKQHFTAERMMIVANGIRNHDEFVQIVQDKINKTDIPQTSNYQRQKAVYVGGEYRYLNEQANDIKIDLAFESVSWEDELVTAFYVMNTLIGNATSFSSGGPGKGMYCRAITNLMQKYNFVDAASAINSHYHETGLFGMSVQGPSQSAKHLSIILLDELIKLKQKINDEELSRAKNILKMNILMAMERKEDRLEEIARNYMTYKKLTFMDYCNSIDKVTSEQINKAAHKALSSKPTLIVSGNNIDQVPSFEQIHRYVNAS